MKILKLFPLFHALMLTQDFTTVKSSTLLSTTFLLPVTVISILKIQDGLRKTPEEQATLSSTCVPITVQPGTAQFMRRTLKFIRILTRMAVQYTRRTYSIIPIITGITDTPRTSLTCTQIILITTIWLQENPCRQALQYSL